MKRSERLLIQSRESAIMSALSSMASVAIGCWVPMSILSDERHPVVIVGMVALALGGLAMALNLAAEAIRLARMANNERRWECEREVRPRL